jgi:hypothetical protein
MLTLTVIRTGATFESATVEFATEDGTALAGRDYVAQTGRIDFAPLEVEREVRIPLLNNSARDGDREFRVILQRSSAGYSLPAASTTAIIKDDEFGFRINDVRRDNTGRARLTLRNPQCRQQYSLEASADLQHWTPVIRQTTCQRTLIFEDASAPNAMRFYRVLTP